MTQKLTLTIDDQVIALAKKYARQKGESLSGVVENYLKSITVQETPKPAISAKISKMIGVIKLPDNFDYKKELANAIIEKHI